MKLAREAGGSLFGEDQLAEFGGLEAVDRSVVQDADRLAALQEFCAFKQGSGTGLAGNSSASGMIK